MKALLIVIAIFIGLKCFCTVGSFFEFQEHYYIYDIYPPATNFTGQIAAGEFFNATEQYQHLQIVVPVLSHFLISLSILPKDAIVVQGVEPHPGPSHSQK